MSLDQVWTRSEPSPQRVTSRVTGWSDSGLTPLQGDEKLRDTDGGTLGGGTARDVTPVERRSAQIEPATPRLRLERLVRPGAHKRELGCGDRWVAADDAAEHSLL